MGEDLNKTFNKFLFTPLRFGMTSLKSDATLNQALSFRSEESPDSGLVTTSASFLAGRRRREKAGKRRVATGGLGVPRYASE